jgi:hypothetical protein
MQAENPGQAEKQGGLASAIVGGVIGAAVGVGLHAVLETSVLKVPGGASWFAIAIGLLTGIGVRMASGGHLERSYMRGAISGLIALGAIVASSFVIKEVMSRREVAVKSGVAPAAAAKDAATDDAESDDADAKADEEPAEEPAVAKDAAPPVGTGIGAPRARATDVSPWQFVFMALGGLVAYELGRGIDHSKRVEPVVDEPGEGLGRATDPSE